MNTVAKMTRALEWASIVAAALLASPAGAQFEGPVSTPAVVSQDSPRRGISAEDRTQPSESNALRWSLGATFAPVMAGMVLLKNDNKAIPYSLLLTGIIIGPSTGYFYGHCAGRGIKGVLGRSVTLGATAYLINRAQHWHLGRSAEAYLGALAIVTLEVTGVAIVVGSVIGDIIKVKAAVRLHNQRTMSPALSVVPKYFARYNAFGFELRLAL